MVLVPRGGLGNQLHQFLVAEELASALKKELVLDARHLPENSYTTKSGVTLFPFALDEFFEFDFKVKKSKWYTTHYFFRYLLELERRLLGIKALHPFFKGVVTSDQIDKGPLYLSSPNRITSSLSSISVSGSSIAKNRQILCESNKPSKKYCELREIQKNENIIGVHVRRGDYVGLSSKYGYISQEWYFSQVEELLPSHDRVFVFSDSKQDAQAFSSVFNPEKVVPIGPNEISSSVEVLILLSHCNSLVLSNSTFSRWALVMGDNFDTVVYPILPENYTRVFDDHDAITLFSRSVLGRKV